MGHPIIGYELGKKLIKVLSLPEGTRSIKLNIPVDDIVSIEADYMPNLKGREEELAELLGLESFYIEKVQIVIHGIVKAKLPEEEGDGKP